MSRRTRRISLAMILAAVGLTAAVGQVDNPPTDDLGTIVDRLLERFPEADADGDGSLSRAEARAVREQIRRAWEQARAVVEPKTPAPPPTLADVPYGPHPRQVLDFWQAPPAAPTPLIVFIHGGGFVGGDKGSIDGAMVRWARRDGISVAAIHYRLVTTDPFPAPMLDAARAVQFLRSKAAAWNLDPDRIAAYGGSAGAGLAMWLGFHDDLADPASPDAVARQSTRLSAVGSIGGQSTYDPIVIRQLVGGRAWEHPSLVQCYALASLDEVDDPAHRPAYDEASAITHLTPDDAPVFMVYSEPDRDLPPEAGPGVGIHHPRFGHLLKARMDELGLDAVYRHRDDGQGGDLRRLLYEFLRDRLRSPAEPGDGPAASDALPPPND